MFRRTTLLKAGSSTEEAQAQAQAPTSPPPSRPTSPTTPTNTNTNAEVDNVDFEEALGDAAVMDAFAAFANEVHVGEAVRFIVDAKRWAALYWDRSPSWRLAKAKTLAGMYISTTAEHQVNVSEAVRDEIEATLASGNVNPRVFHAAVTDLIRNTAQDSWPRFLKRQRERGTPVTLSSSSSWGSGSGSSWSIASGGNGPPSPAETHAAVVGMSPRLTLAKTKTVGGGSGILFMPTSATSASLSLAPTTTVTTSTSAS